MSLLDEIMEKAGVSEQEINMGQRRVAFLKQIEEVIESNDLNEKEVLQDLNSDKEKLADYFDPRNDLTLEQIVKIETALGEKLFTMNRNVDI